MRLVVLSFFVFNGPLCADVYFQPTSFTKQLIEDVAQGNSQNIQMLIEQGADVNVHVGSLPLLIKAIEDLGQCLQALEENRTKLWIGRCLIGLGAVGLLWAGCLHVSSKPVQREGKRDLSDYQDDLNTDDPPTAPQDNLSHTQGPQNSPTADAGNSPGAGVPSAAPKCESAATAAAFGRNAEAPREGSAPAQPLQSQSVDCESDDDSPPPPYSPLQQQPPPPVQNNKSADQRGNPLPPKPAPKVAGLHTQPTNESAGVSAKEGRSAKPTANTTFADDVPTSDRSQEKPGLWKRFKNWLSPMQRMQADIAPLYAGAVITGITTARTAGKAKASSVKIADRVAVIMALLDIPELDLWERNQAQETAFEVIDRYLGVIKNKQSQETLMAIGNSIRREAEYVLD